MRAFAASHPAADRPLRFDEAASRTLTAVERAPYQVITKIANYVERGALGGAQVILTRDLGLGEREAYDILRSSSSTREALIQAYGQMNVDSRNVRLARLARQLQHTYASANADARLTAAIAVMAGAPTPGRGTTGSTCPAGESPCYCGARYVGCRPDILCTGPCR